MLMLVRESRGKTRTVADVARELSLNLKFFADGSALGQALSHKSRRIVFLTESDIEPEVLIAMSDLASDTSLGLVVAADREALRSSSRAKLVEKIAAFENIEWIGKTHSVDNLCHAARSCRRRMLRVSEEELERAIEEEEFLIQYQPKVERTGGDEWLTREAEALLRWRHPQHGVMGPLEFLPELEAFEMMGRVSELVLHEAATQLVKWRQQDLPLNSCINLAPSLLNEQDLADRYEIIVLGYGLNCANFTFEVAEHDIANSDAPHLKVLQSLRDKGFRISLDDFGVAASSLSTFEQLPFDEVKIHSLALNRAMTNPVAQQVLAAVTGLAHNLGISVCAEGVEDQATFEFLKTIQCDKMQGFLISEAVMPDIVRRVYSAKSSVDEVA
jgi:EAL domain-containing protein (putative c-di-GMP-specific phosphodiesterase class I)